MLRILFYLLPLLFSLSGCATFQPFEAESARSHPVDYQPELPVMAETAGKGRVTFISNGDGLKIPVRIYGEKNRGVPVLMIHGLQSHSGWFVQSAAHIASQGIPVYQVDRRGSGLSEEPRGHAASYEEMLADILTVARYAMQQHGVEKVHLLGHCFGAIPSAAFAGRYPELLQSLILCTPAIYTHTGVYFREGVQIVSSELTHHHKYIPIHIKATEFTDDAEYLSFIESDPLALKQVTTALYFQVPLARHSIVKQGNRINMPLFIGMAAGDSICDNEKNREFFNTIPAERKMMVTYPNARHILEFSKDRDTFFNDLTAWLSATAPIAAETK
ncbi:MAG: alpha/beta fold hydrolase [Thermodesulfobacteriota bacterium]